MKIPFPLLVCLSEQLSNVSEEREREVVVNVSPEREMAPPYPLGDLHLVNVLIEMLTAFDELIFPHMILPFPSLSVMFSADSDVMLSVPSEETLMTGLLSVNISEPCGVI